MAVEDTDVSRKHIRTLRVVSGIVWLLTIALLYLSSLLPLFDSSPKAVLTEATWRNRLVQPLLRWDVFHFLHIAQHGYVYEHEWAFFPGIAAAMTYPARLAQQLGFAESSNGSLSVTDLLASGALLSSLCGSTTTLYRLTLHHFGSPSVAYLAALLSLFPSSPATLRFSTYNEPFFTYLSYKGMLSCAVGDFWVATVFFTCAAALRSNGTMLAGFILWSLVALPALNNARITVRQVSQAVLCTMIICGPFIMHQFSAYRQFCTQAPTSPPWCSSAIPSIYDYVQKTYWKSGFLLYWTPAQLPNILLAVPILVSVLSFSYAQITSSAVPAAMRHPLVANSPLIRPLYALRRPKDSVFFVESITPHVIHASIMCSILLFAAHTQIALRLAASMPTTYWAAARLMVDHPRSGKWWVAWSVIWGAISVVLWAVFLPPA